MRSGTYTDELYLEHIFTAHIVFQYGALAVLSISKVRRIVTNTFSAILLVEKKKFHRSMALVGLKNCS
jgi:hypothetical protein